MQRPRRRGDLPWLAAEGLRRSAMLLTLVSLWCGSAEAQQRSAEHERGRAALRAGRAAEAAAILSRTYAREHRPAVLLDLAIAAERAGRPHGAAVAYREYLRAVGPDAPLAPTVQEQLRRLQRDSAVLVPELDPPNAKLVIDGRRARPLDGEVFTTPGPHTLRIEAPGYIPFEQSQPLPRGRVALRLSLVPLPGTVPGQVVEPGGHGRVTEPTPEAGSDEVSVGPVATFGLLAPLGIGLQLRTSNYLGFGVDLQLLPPVGGNEVAITSGGLFMHVHPTARTLFFSGGVGIYHISAVDSGMGTKAQGSITFPGLTLGFGLMGRDGFVLGFDLTLLVPLTNPSVGVSVIEGNPSPDQAALLEESVRTTIAGVKSFLPVIPQLNLLRIGWLF